MNVTVRRRVGLVVLTLSMPVTAAAQGITSSFAELRALVGPGDTVYVTDVSGREARAKIIDLSPSSLRLLVADRERVWAEGDVREIRQPRRDSLLNGAGIGFGVGAGLVLLGSALCPSCGGDPGPGELVSAALGVGLVYAGVGAGIDALISERKVIYRKHATTSVRIGFRPDVSQAGRAVVVFVRF